MYHDQRIALRRIVLRRDGPDCFWCDAPTSLETFLWPPVVPRRAPNPYRRTLDHLIPRREGGTHDPRNIVIACIRCNGNRGHTNAVEWAIRCGKLDRLIEHLDRVLTPARAEATVGASMEASHG